MRRISIITGLVVVILAGGLIGYRRLAAEKNEAPVFEPVEIRVQVLEQGIESSAVVQPRNRIAIKPPIGGRIDEVLVEEGQYVQAGDVIARMSSTERATLLDAARARGPEVIRKWKEVYKSTSLIAPLDGTIIARNTEPGQTVTASDTLLTLSDRLIVMANLDETDIGRIAIGQSARITLDAYRAFSVSGQVSRIAYDATTINNVTIYGVEVEPAEVPPQMKSGMTASVIFLLARVEDALTLPVDAVVSGKESSYVWVAVDQGTDHPLQRRPVVTGLSVGGWIEIVDGLTGEEHVMRKPFTLRSAEERGASPFMPSPGSRRK